MIPQIENHHYGDLSLFENLTNLVVFGLKYSLKYE